MANRFSILPTCRAEYFPPVRPGRAISSVVERLLHTQEVAGSNPASRTVTAWPSRAYCTLKTSKGDAVALLAALTIGDVSAGRR